MKQHLGIALALTLATGCVVEVNGAPPKPRGRLCLLFPERFESYANTISKFDLSLTTGDLEGGGLLVRVTNIGKTPREVKASRMAYDEWAFDGTAKTELGDDIVDKATKAKRPRFTIQPGETVELEVQPTVLAIEKTGAVVVAHVLLSVDGQPTTAEVGSFEVRPRP